MRIIAGKFRSRQLKSLKGLALRPTSDMLRETLFNILGPLVQGSRFLELFAGTGAVGIEAISRGAKFVVFVENHPAAVRLIRGNLASLEIKSEVRIIATAVAPALARLETENAAAKNERDTAFDFIFLDPPYANKNDYELTFDVLSNSSLLSESAILIAEHHKKSPLKNSVGSLQQFRTLTQGDASLSFYRRSAQPLS